jgi:hypothetical protein
MRNTIAVSTHSGRQSQFWPWSRFPFRLRSGRMTAPVQPSAPAWSSASSSRLVRPAGEDARPRHHFGAGVDHHHLLELDPGAVGDAAHFFEVGLVEILDLAEALGDQPFAPGLAQAEFAELPAIELGAGVDPPGHRRTILPAALVGRSGHRDEGEGSDHRRRDLWKRRSIVMLRQGLSTRAALPAFRSRPFLPYGPAGLEEIGMEYRTLGGSGLMIPALIFGTATFGGGSEFLRKWGATDVAEATALVDIALEAGCTMFDTADGYSTGLSEEILGQAIKGGATRC